MKSKTTLYLVGKMQIQDTFGTGRLLLYSIFKTEQEAENYTTNYVNRYYKHKPYLCPLIIKKIEI